MPDPIVSLSLSGLAMTQSGKLLYLAVDERGNVVALPPEERFPVTEKGKHDA